MKFTLLNVTLPSQRVGQTPPVVGIDGWVSMIRKILNKENKMQMDCKHVESKVHCDCGETRNCHNTKGE